MLLLWNMEKGMKLGKYRAVDGKGCCGASIVEGVRNLKRMMRDGSTSGPLTSVRQKLQDSQCEDDSVSWKGTVRKSRLSGQASPSSWRLCTPEATSSVVELEKVHKTSVC